MTMSISQSSYAQDSLIVITADQLKQTNLLFNKLEMLERVDSINTLKLQKLEEANDLLRFQLRSTEIEFSICDEVNTKLKEENSQLHSDIKTAKKAVVGSSILWGCLVALLILL